MSLRETAATDLVGIVNGPTGGDDVTITSPAGSSATVKGFVQDIYLAIDPGTGEQVSGRKASVSVLISDLETEGFSDIHGVAESTSRPWLVAFADAQGAETTFKVTESNPDRGLGLMVLFLEEYGQ